MNSGRIGERSIFNNFSHAQNGKVKKNFSVGDIVLVLQEESVRNQWPMARVIQVFKGGNGYVRSIKLRIGKTRISDEGNRILERPVSKIVLLVEQDCVPYLDE